MQKIWSWVGSAWTPGLQPPPYILFHHNGSAKQKPQFSRLLLSLCTAKLLFEFSFAVVLGEQACSTGPWCDSPECNLPDPWEKSGLAS